MELDLEAVLDAMDVGVFVCDANGDLVAINAAGLQIVGAGSLEEVRGRAPRPFHFPEVRSEEGTPFPPDCMPMRRALAGEDVVYEVEVLDQPARGTIMLRTRTRPLRGSDGAIVGAVKLAVDITREHRLAVAKDEFIRQIAHELKTPIAVIRANAEAVLASDTRPSQQQMRGLVRGVDRMDGLINSLLDLLDLQGGFFSFARTPITLDRVLEGAIRRLPPRAARRIQLVGVRPVRVRGDEARLRRAFSSIIDNALKYSPSTEPVEVALSVDGAAVRVAIRDHGSGIPADLQPRIFEKYFRAHAGTPLDAGGIGVGLYIAREIVAQHGGRLWFESTEHVGSVFYVEVPIEPEAR